jgi:hypothetical protein
MNIYTSRSNRCFKLSASVFSTMAAVGLFALSSNASANVDVRDPAARFLNMKNFCSAKDTRILSYRATGKYNSNGQVWKVWNGRLDCRGLWGQQGKVVFAWKPAASYATIGLEVVNGTSGGRFTKTFSADSNACFGVRKDRSVYFMENKTPGGTRDCNPS